MTQFNAIMMMLVALLIQACNTEAGRRLGNGNGNGNGNGGNPFGQESGNSPNAGGATLAPTLDCAPGGVFECYNVPWAVYKNGLYWALAGPVANKVLGHYIDPIPYGWRFPTEEEFLLRPDALDFAEEGTMTCTFAQNAQHKCLCAAHVFTNSFQRCDINDYKNGQVAREWNDESHSHPDFYDIIYVREGAAPPPVQIQELEPAIVCDNTPIVVPNDAGRCGAAVDVTNKATSPRGLPITNDAPAEFPVGETVVTFTAGGETCSITVTVNDVEAPTIQEATVSEGYLWPPNHKYRGVSVNVQATDNCPDSIITCTVGTVTMNEVSQWEKIGGGPNCGLGGEVYQILGPLTLNLCSERNGKGDGRIYTVGGGCNDGHNDKVAGFAAQSIVPKSMSLK